MREVILAPHHSQWWLLSPGVTLYFDRLLLLRSDYEDTLRSAGGSTYDGQVAQHLEALVHRGEDPVISLVDTVAGLDRDYDKRADFVRAQLYRRAEDPDDPLVTPQDILRLTTTAYRHWIAHNERKLRYLAPAEQYRLKLERDALPQWRKSQHSVQSLMDVPTNEMLSRFRELPSAEPTLTRLLAAACRCIDLVDAGLHIYDPMLVEYLPAIALVERLRITRDLADSRPDLSGLFNAYHIRMARYGDIVPIDLKIEELPHVVAQYRKIRHALGRVDDTLRSIEADDPAQAFDQAKEQIALLVQEAHRAAQTVEYGFWAIGMVSTLCTCLGAPDLVKTAADAAAALALVDRNVGRFAGAYALVADAMIAAQRVFHAADSARLDHDYFRKHYWDFPTRPNDHNS